jgi:hypothetical protein
MSAVLSEGVVVSHAAMDDFFRTIAHRYHRTLL